MRWLGGLEDVQVLTRLGRLAEAIAALEPAGPGAPTAGGPSAVRPAAAPLAGDGR